MSVQLGNEGFVEMMAFSPTGKLIATASDSSSVVLWQAATGREIRGLRARGIRVTELNFSEDERALLTVTRLAVDKESAYSLQLWSTATGEVKDFGDLAKRPKRAAVAKDGQQMFVEDEDGSVRLFDIASGEPVKSLKAGEPEAAAAAAGLTVRPAQSAHEVVSPDGRYQASVLLTEDPVVLLKETATGKSIYLDMRMTHVHEVLFSPESKYLLGNGEAAVLWDVSTGKQLQRFDGLVGPVYSASFSEDGRTILTAGLIGEKFAATTWDTERGAERRRFEQPANGLALNLLHRFSAALSPDGSSLVTGTLLGDALMWKTETGRPARALSREFGKMYALDALAFSTDGRRLLVSTFGGASLWDANGARPLAELKGQKLVNWAAFSSDGRMVVTVDDDKRAVVWDAQTGKPIGAYNKHSDRVLCAAFSRDNRYLITAEMHGAVRVWDNATGGLVNLWQETTEPVTSVAFAPDGNYVLAGGTDGVARLWDRRTGAVAQRYEGHTWVHSVAFSNDGAFVLTAGQDGTTRLWSTTSAEELCRFVSFKDGTWAVVTPDGRFDTNNLEHPEGIYWLMPDAPTSPLPLEIFMRDYYEPRLLSRLLDDVPDEEQFRALHPLGGLNRAQPSIERIAVSRSAPDAVTVQVTAASTDSTVQKGADGRALASGIYDLRLFRDGHLVGYTTREEDEALAGADEELPRWREANRIAPRRGDEGGPDCAEAAPRSVVCTFRVRLPRRANLKRVEFSAYAFNSDRVKSETARTVYEVDTPPPAVLPRAYVIGVGADEYDNPAFRGLSYAVNDALAVRDVIAQAIRLTRRYEVIPITLLSRHGGGAAADGATKANVKAVLDVLAGRADPQTLSRLPSARGVRRAEPEDLVLLSFSGHGYADRRGSFYLVPPDTSGGLHLSADEVVPRLLSSEELSQWLRGVDAGELVLIIDACHSAAAAGASFRPGPMGDRGLGQLSYDKGMRILAATQAESEALEAAVLADGRRAEHGLLTYALVREGLELGLADEGPQKDGVITLGEWLRYGERRVPELRAGATNGKTVGPREESAEVERQRPALFDFARGRADVVLKFAGAGVRQARRRRR